MDFGHPVNADLVQFAVFNNYDFVQHNFCYVISSMCALYGYVIFFTNRSSAQLNTNAATSERSM